MWDLLIILSVRDSWLKRTRQHTHQESPFHTAAAQMTNCTKEREIQTYEVKNLKGAFPQNMYCAFYLHITFWSGRSLGQKLRSLPLFSSRIFTAISTFWRPRIQITQTPEFCGAHPADQYATSLDVAMEKIFAMEKVLQRKKKERFLIC